MSEIDRPRRVDLDLGDGHTLRFMRWAPDRALNPQYAAIPDIEKCGAIVSHTRPDNGKYCEGIVHFNLFHVEQLFPTSAVWQVVNWSPLTVSPSLRCTASLFDENNKLIPGSECGDHGHIIDGRWVRC